METTKATVRYESQFVNLPIRVQYPNIGTRTIHYSYRISGNHNILVAFIHSDLLSLQVADRSIGIGTLGYRLPPPSHFRFEGGGGAEKIDDG